MTGKIDKILKELGTNNSSQIATAVLAGFKMIFLPIATATDKNASHEQKKYTIVRDIIMEGLALITYIGVTGQIQKHVTAPICSAYFRNKAKLLEQGKLFPSENISNDELKSVIETLKNADSKKIKEAGEAFLTQISKKPKVMSDNTKNHIQLLENAIEKVNGNTSKSDIKTLDEYVKEITGRLTRKTSVLIKNDSQKAAQNTVKILNPIKVFQNTRIALSQLSVWVLALAIIPPMCNALISPTMKSINKNLEKKQSGSRMELQPFNRLDKQHKTTFTKFYNYFPNNNTGMRV